MRPSYLEGMTRSELLRRAEALEDLTACCRLCPRACQARRLEGRPGKCGIAHQAVVFSASPHFGEEPPLVGSGGSGTIFFSGCNLRCLYCQNHRISSADAGRPLDAEELAQLMLELQAAGCHNINLVTPTHVAPQIVRALSVAAGRGLSLPLVYNCGGYESLETLRLLDGVVDIYMPDLKYSNEAVARECSGVEQYWLRARQAVCEMHRQVGDLTINGQGIARRGLLIRHLVLPGDLAGSARVLEFICREISRDTYVNIMDQYRPAHRAYQHPVLRNGVSAGELARVRAYARTLGLHRGIDTLALAQEDPLRWFDA